MHLGFLSSPDRFGSPLSHRFGSAFSSPSSTQCGSWRSSGSGSDRPLPQAHRFGSHFLLTNGSDRGHLTGSVRVVSHSLDRIGSAPSDRSPPQKQVGSVAIIGSWSSSIDGSDRSIGSDRPYFLRSGPVRMISCSSSSEQFTPFDGVFDKSNTSNQS